MTEKHEMVLQTTHSSGAEEWFCPTCGRCLLVKWEPRFTKSVLQPGDEFAIHSGEKGGVGIGYMQVATEDNIVLQEISDIQLEDERLAPWIEWLDQVGFERLWNE